MNLLVEVLVMWMLAVVLFAVVVVALFGLTGFRAGAGSISQVRVISAESVPGHNSPVLIAASMVGALAGRVWVVTRWRAALVVPCGI